MPGSSVWEQEYWELMVLGGCCRAVGLGEGIRVGGCCRAKELGRNSGGIRAGKDIEDP